jgi:hypothetical protein
MEVAKYRTIDLTQGSRGGSEDGGCSGHVQSLSFSDDGVLAVSHSTGEYHVMSASGRCIMRSTRGTRRKGRGGGAGGTGQEKGEGEKGGEETGSAECVVTNVEWVRQGYGLYVHKFVVVNGLMDPCSNNSSSHPPTSQDPSLLLVHFLKASNSLASGGISDVLVSDDHLHFFRSDNLVQVSF